ncbi:D-Ala-D-Ala carboxypeptidase family metallohydrolase [Paracoccus rhizosphaerae]|uniref:D-Ala-D-Ala carboxypeptidase family metallohydrolase n=1 Tax=Paracoccus rhizosphaerae TaxID=1133347 RepID=A0ABV6CH67_9RHOB|nr:D-Ala-D-Ala carboxypeptidase family metallohydrolase [Paracoccus rhizosphaerae]
MSNDNYEGAESDAVGFEEAGKLLSNLRSGDEPQELKDFRKFFDQLEYKPQHFHADEFMVMGPSNSNPGSNCRGKNSLPPQPIWNNVIPLVIALDAIREELGYSVRITNCFRASPYNQCVGGASSSQHVVFKAADFVGEQENSAAWADAAKAVRGRGIFAGGVGIYSGFVHVDVRGSEANWDNR